MTVLSEKAKGKQKAVEPPSGVTVSQAPAIPLESFQVPTRDLVVRFTEGLPDLTVPVNQQDAVRDVKQKVNMRSSFAPFFITYMQAPRFVMHDHS
jgi:hypothetical protein